METARPTEVKDIRWFKGLLEQAMAAAAQNHKLLMVYSGAKWCPYCQTLRKTVLGRQDCHRLDFSGWDPAALQGVGAAKLATLLTEAAVRCEGPEQMRLPIAALNFALRGNVDPAGLKPGVQKLYVLLDQPEMIRVAIDFLALHMPTRHAEDRAAISQINTAVDQWAGTAQRRSVAAEVRSAFGATVAS